ncbi:MAG TPA: hypothetical protein VNX47_11480 [Nevskia sp.]|nr:hypothetical protein [Nevskia sp.]
MKYGLAAAVPPLLGAMLAACGSGSTPLTAASSADPAALCVSSGCGTKTRLLEIPNAENTLFTPDGRLFVSGGSNVYEVTRDAAGFHAAPLYDGTCNFTGMAQRGEILYVACFDLHLYALHLDQAGSRLQPIHALAGMAAPNGMSDGPDGELYLTDGPLSTSQLPSPKIVRLDFDAADPLKVTQQTTWLSQGVGLPNGLTRRDRTLYFSTSSILPPALGLVNSVAIQADGTAGPVRTLSTLETSVPDDMSVVGDDLLLALYSEGAIALIGPDGSILSQTAPLSFDLPSSVKTGRPPLFDPTDLVVTEKGVVGVSQTGSLFGNALSVYRRNP